MSGETEGRRPGQASRPLEELPECHETFSAAYADAVGKPMLIRGEARRRSHSRSCSHSRIRCRGRSRSLSLNRSLNHSLILSRTLSRTLSLTAQASHWPLMKPHRIRAAVYLVARAKHPALSPLHPLSSILYHTFLL